MNGLLELVADAYQRNIGNPARQLVGNGVRGLLGLDPADYADSFGMEAYRNAAAIGNAPGINAPVGAFKAAARVAPELAMFIGAAAKTWDAASNAKAVQMEKAGKDAREIWRETGNLKGPDGKWRQEISDRGARITKEPLEFDAKGSLPLPDVIAHKQLFAAYPDMASIPVRKDDHARLLDTAGYIDYKDTIDIGSKGQLWKRPGNTGDSFLMPNFTRKSLVHEMQHAVQQREGFAKGGNPARHGAKYERLAGEAEARATQARMNMTPVERRATFPYDSYDVPVDQLIVRGLLSR